MKLKRTALIILSGMIPIVAAAADDGNISGRTNLVGTISAVRAETGDKRMIPVLTLDRPLTVDGPNGSTRQRTFVSLTMANPPGAPKRPVLGDGDPFTRWSGKRVRVEGSFAPLKRGTVPMLHVTSIEADK